MITFPFRKLAMTSDEVHLKATDWLFSVATGSL